MQSHTPLPTTPPAPRILNYQPANWENADQDSARFKLPICEQTADQIVILHSAATLACYYQDYFPDETAWREEPFHWQAESAGEQICQMIEEFLTRVNEQLFPVVEEVWAIDMELCRHFLHQIPIIPQGIEPHWNSETENQLEPIPLLQQLAFPDWFVDEPKLSHLAQFPAQFDLEQARFQLQQQPPPAPFDGLSALIDLILADNDNLWLDISYNEMAEVGHEIYWSKEHVQQLSQLWQEAKPILDQAWTLIRYCNPSHDNRDIARNMQAERLDEVVHLLLN